jgi:Holliday junction resolvasome RuvABC DNA-binding subunit
MRQDKGIFDDALSALINLGYPSKAANNAVEKACTNVKEMTLEGVIKEAFRILA